MKEIGFFPFGNLTISQVLLAIKASFFFALQLPMQDSLWIDYRRLVQVHE